MPQYIMFIYAVFICAIATTVPAFSLQCLIISKSRDSNHTARVQYLSDCIWQTL